MRYAPFTVLVAAAIVFGVACGGDGDSGSKDRAGAATATLSAESIPWIQTLEPPLQLFETFRDQADRAHPDAFTTGDGIQAYADELLDDNEEVLEALRELAEPPAEFAEAFGAYMGAMESLMELLATPPAVPDDVLAALGAVDDACFGIQEIAGPVVDLRCSGEDVPLAFNEYYEKVIPLLRAAHDKHRAAQDAFDALPADAAEDERRAAVEAYVKDVAAGYLAARQAMRVMEPPEEVEDAHTQYRRVANRLRNAVRDIQGVLDEDASAAGTDAALAMIEEELVPALTLARGLCSMYQGLADANALGIDFDCEK